MKKKVITFFWWFFWIIFLELIYKGFIIKDIISINTFSVMLFSLPIISILSIICSIFNKTINKILTILLSGFIMLFTLAQIVYYNFYNSIFSFFSLTTGTGQVMQFWERIVDIILSIWYIFVIVLIPYILFIIFSNKIFTFEKNNLKRNIAILIIMVISFIGITLRVVFDNNGLYSLQRLLFKTHAPMLTISKTGLNTMQLLDLGRYIFGFEEEIINNEEIEEPVIEIEEEIIEYNMLEINFDELIQNETNSNVKKLHEYFSSVMPTEKNEYTGMFKGKNLVYVTAEAFDTIAIDENITPTLYKMANNSFIFENYYQPLYPVSTTDGEYMNLTSLLPKEGVWSLYKTSKLDMSVGIGNMFKKENYLAYAFHNHTHTYYKRNLSHPNLGFEYMGCGNGLQKIMNCKRWPNSDKEMIEATMSYYMEKEQPFLAYYMTVSGHLNYNFTGNHMAMRHKSEVKDLPYSTAVKAYYATQIELDQAMELLLQTLEEKGILEDTLIIIAPDHYPYGLDTKEINEVSAFNRKDKFEQYHTSLIMYNPTIEKTVIEDTISGIDILPTIYNLYGLEYDSRIYMGRDIFSEQEHLVILSDRSWITAKGKYNSVNGKFTKTTEEELNEEEYVSKMNKIANDRFTISSTILDTNYYKKLGLQ